MKNWYKANLHCHTTVSDGNHTPEEIKQMYMAQGYSIVAFTDHNVFESHSHLNDANFLAINACEININSPMKSKTDWQRCGVYHFNLYATCPDMTTAPPLPTMDYSDHEAINRYIAERNAEGFLVSYNHPYWSMQTYEEYSKLQGCFAMEIYNHNCEMEGFYGHHPQAYDEMLRSGQKLFCLAVDDNHNGGFPDSFGGFIYVNSPSLDYEDVMKALTNGDFYSSQGPLIHEFSVKGDVLTIECSPVALIVVYTQGRRCYIKKGENLTKAQFHIEDQDGYVRVMCRDKDKKEAYSNAIWL
ncbi:MAG: CehA/McbA family metallohydrolase [Defluviitaleaceae bacterium]|nr:CehA/McbA family metallohydrolase [Defluviitaleaceae bacterium]